MRARTLALSGALAALLAASGCSVGGGDQDASPKPTTTPTSLLDSDGKKACDLFAKFQADGAHDDARTDTATQVRDWSHKSKSGELSGKADVLFNVADQGRTETWALAADSFASECLHLGWKP
jgi:hypothetical protein